MEALAGEILEMCIAFGGSITGEHSMGMEKKNYLHRMFRPDDVLMCIRTAIDPREISNPGKMFPGGDAPASPILAHIRSRRRGVISQQGKSK